ncbi:MAG: MBL fold metallo-hydrolase [Acidobacteria bacterium]|nr:MBL fold metallo-hydrolase [Acidobacteriota bacterium]
MKLTILGSGTVVPNGERNSAGYFVEAEGVRLMLDCGAGTVPALARYNVEWESMTHIFLSHFHVDHIGELASLFFAFRHGMQKARTAPLTLIAPRGVERILYHLKEAFGEKLFTPKFSFDLIEVEPGDRLRLTHDCLLSVAKTPHTAESLALRLDHQDCTFAYTGDTAFHIDLARFFQRADLLVSECSFQEAKEGATHLSIAEVARLASQAQVKKLVVTHFYFAVEEAALQSELQRQYHGEIFIGRDGMTIEINR